MSAGLKKKLAAAKKAWKKAKKSHSEDAGFAEYSDGVYIMQFSGCEFGESQNGRFQATCQWTFLEGEFRGQKYRDYMGLETAENLVWVARLVSRLGGEVADDFGDLEGELQGLAKQGPICRVVLKTSGEYQNLRLQRLLKDAEEDDFDGESEDDDEDVDEDDDDTEESDDESEESDDDDEDDDSDDDEDESDDDEEESDDEDDDEDDEDEDVPEEPKPKPKKGKGKGKKRRK